MEGLIAFAEGMEESERYNFDLRRQAKPRALPQPTVWETGLTFHPNDPAGSLEHLEKIVGTDILERHARGELVRVTIESYGRKDTEGKSLSGVVTHG